MVSDERVGRRVIEITNGISSAETAETIGLMHTWWRGDALPALPPLPGLSLSPAEDELLLTELTDLDQERLRERLAHNHQPWLARLRDEPVGYGWVATDRAAIPHLGLRLTFRPSDRSLWDFATLPPWRGQGIYPRLLQAILRHEAAADRFWVGHDHDNVASRHGIARAGFHRTGTLDRLPEVGYRFVPSPPSTAPPRRPTCSASPLARLAMTSKTGVRNSAGRYRSQPRSLRSFCSLSHHSAPLSSLQVEAAAPPRSLSHLAAAL